MKSFKRIKTLNEILKPFSFIPKKTISGGVNGKNFLFERGKVYKPTFGEYELLINTGYEKEITY